jgi:hypothetical protein
VRPLGRLERESVDEALAFLGLAVDHAPAGKIIGRVHVINLEVFSRRDWWFQWFNIFHRTTRAVILEREILLHPGDRYDQALVEESTRNLQSGPPLTITGRTFSPPELSSVVAILPVLPVLPLVSPRPEQVDLLVVTRDVWSLRFNTDFDFQQNTLAFLSTSLSENNLFGWRKFLSVGLVLDQGSLALGPTYFDPNILGSRLTLFASTSFYYARETERYEGNQQTVSLHYPLYALASRWGAGVDVTHQNFVVRSFRGNNLRIVDLAATPDVEMLPYTFRERNLIVDSSVVRSFGSDVIQRVSVGHLFSSQRPQVFPDFPGDATLAREFLDAVAPVSEQRSEPYLRYEMFTPRYVVLRDLDTFDLRENRLLGPFMRVRLSYGLPAIGADFRALGLSTAVGWAASPAGGYLLLSASASTRVRDGAAIDQLGSVQTTLATPMLGRLIRLVVMGQLDSTRANTQRTRFALGGRTGLRGYAIGDFLGTNDVVGHVELRTAPLAIFSQRLGTLLFYDVGDAADSLRALVPYHDFGIGLRWLIPQLNSSVVRFDWALAAQSTDFTRAGFPGRVTAGFQQVF